MRITYDPAKREQTILDRGLDFEDAPEVFRGVTVEIDDVRKDYGERTPRGDLPATYLV